MSAKILQFVSKAQRDRSRDEFANVFRSKAAPDDLVMDHADTAPCECIGPGEPWTGSDPFADPAEASTVDRREARVDEAKADKMPRREVFA